MIKEVYEAKHGNKSILAKSEGVASDGFYLYYDDAHSSMKLVNRELTDQESQAIDNYNFVVRDGS